ncbi:MAG: hypothetical protein Q9159_004583 [Coniocarpon cinnabarinum]
MSSFAPQALCPDWALHNNSNVHLAVDRQWFISYTPFASQVLTGMVAGLLGGGQTLPVIGVGTVEIPVKVRDGIHRTLRLDDVVHVPDYVCNIVASGLILAEHDLVFSYHGPSDTGKLTNRNGKISTVTKRGHSKLCLLLSGPPVGPVTRRSAFDNPSQKIVGVGATWHEDERSTWNLRRDLEWLKDFETRAPHSNAVPLPLTSEERNWLEVHCGNESHFMKTIGLSIYADEDRAKGRTILQRLMSRDKRDDSDNYDDGVRIQVPKLCVEVLAWRVQLEMDPPGVVAEVMQLLNV